MRRSRGPEEMCAGVLACVALFATAARSQGEDGPMTDPSRYVLVGTYTGGGSEGIYVFRWDGESGALTPVSVVGGIENPSFLAAHPSGAYVYAVEETGEGAVYAYAFDRTTCELTLLTSQPAHGAAPCHLTVDPSGRCVVVANYTSGTVSVLPIAEDGTLEPATEVIQHEGSGPNAARQEGPHAHSVTLDPTGERILAADLGLDKVLVYRLDAVHGKLAPNDPPYGETAPGAGPRHVAFHPSGRFGYVVDELDSTIMGFAYEERTGALTRLETVPTLPPDYNGVSHCADIHFGPDGRFLYASNRGHDSIVVYAADPRTGLLEWVEHESTLGETPRNFAIDPSGRFLLAANQDTNTIVTFAITPESGRLEPTGEVASVPNPVCVLFMPGPG